MSSEVLWPACHNNLKTKKKTKMPLVLLMEEILHMENLQLFLGFHVYKVVQNFFHQRQVIRCRNFGVHLARYCLSR